MSTPCVAQKVPANQVNTRADIGWEEVMTQLGIEMLRFWHLQSGRVSLQKKWNHNYDFVRLDHLCL